jgi:hypothetical protein
MNARCSRNNDESVCCDLLAPCCRFVWFWSPWLCCWYMWNGFYVLMPQSLSLVESLVLHSHIMKWHFILTKCLLGTNSKMMKYVISRFFDRIVTFSRSMLPSPIFGLPEEITRTSILPLSGMVIGDSTFVLRSSHLQKTIRMYLDGDVTPTIMFQPALAAGSGFGDDTGRCPDGNLSLLIQLIFLYRSMG